MIGLAPSEIAARQLEAEAGPTLAANTARWLTAAERDPARWALRRGDLVLVDEAGMVSDAHLARIVQAARVADARVLLVGDPGQLPSPGAGAAYAMVTRLPGTLTLSEVRRFAHAWEAAASLRLRAGDPAALDAYDRRARIHSGTARADGDPGLGGVAGRRRRRASVAAPGRHQRRRRRRERPGAGVAGSPQARG